MTKWFVYHSDKEHWFLEDFEEYFEDKEDVFSSWLKTSYEITVNNQKIWKITVVVYENKADFNIVYNNNMGYSAGSIGCFCESDLLNGILQRIYDPDQFIKPA